MDLGIQGKVALVLASSKPELWYERAGIITFYPVPTHCVIKELVFTFGGDDANCSRRSISTRQGANGS